jgi:hypothetical protein
VCARVSIDAVLILDIVHNSVARSKMWTASNIDNHFASNTAEQVSIDTIEQPEARYAYL